MPDLQIAPRRMRNSRLTGTPFETANRAVAWHGAMQAQDYGPAKWSIGQRAARLTDQDLDEALASGSIIRTHVLRPTWHFVAKEDVRWLLALTGPRVQQQIAPRYRQLGLDERTRARCQEVIASALEGGNHLTRDGIAAVLDDRRIDRAGQRLPHILMHCELEAAVCSGGLSGRKHTYALLDERVPDDRPFDRDEALVELTRRFLRSHGPASVKDLRWWSSLTVADITRALDLLGSEVRSRTVDGLTFWSIGTDTTPPPAARGGHLLQAYDELIVGYTESRFFADPRAQEARAAWQDRRLPTGIILLNGGVAGHWRRTVERRAVRIQAVFYDGPTRAALRALEHAAADLGRFLGREVRLDAAGL